MSDQSQNNQWPSSPDAKVDESTNVRFLPGLSGQVRTIILSIIVGIIVGAAAALLKFMIGHVTGYLKPFMRSDEMFDWTLMILPVIGILLTVIYQRYVLRDSVEHGVERLVNDLDGRRFLLNPRLTYAPLIASTFTLGFGGSAGSEGPIAYSGAAIGSNVGRLCGVSSDTIYLLIGCGACAGIAGIFKAPLGGVLFALEVLGMAYTTASVLALFAASIASVVTVFILTGSTVNLPWSHNVEFELPILLWVAGLGIFCGLYSIYYFSVMKRMRRFYDSMRSHWIANLLSALILGGCLILLPCLYGEGYNIMDLIINDKWNVVTAGSPFTQIGIGNDYQIIIVLSLILLLKAFACSASNSGGGVAGDFAPTLFAGCIAGMLFALVANCFFGQHLAPQLFAFIGMCGVMSGVIKAPLMAIFLTAEICSGLNNLIPLATVGVISYCVVKVFTNRRFFEIRFYRHGRLGSKTLQ